MLSGRRLDLLDPSPLDIEIEDIAHGLARVARWNGQTIGEHIFSVAQHRVLVVEELDAMRAGPARRRAAGGAAARRARICDRRHDLALQGGRSATSYKAFEARLLGAIHLRFGLPAEPPAAVKALTKKADRVAAFFEATQLAGFGVEESCRIFGDPRPLPRPMDGLKLVPLPAAKAQQFFLDRFVQIFR